MKIIFHVLVVLAVLSIGVFTGFTVRGAQVESLLSQSIDFETVQFVTPASASSQGLGGGSGSCGS